MKIDKKGKYKLLKDYTVRQSYSVKTLLKGTVLNVNQISDDYHKVISPELGDWVYWELPVEAV